MRTGKEHFVLVATIVTGLILVIAIMPPRQSPELSPAHEYEKSSLPADPAKLLIGRLCSGSEVIIEYSWLNWYMESGADRAHLEKVAMASDQTISKQRYDELTNRLYYLRDLMPVGTDRMLVDRYTTLSPRFTHGRSDHAFGDYLC